MHWKNILVPLGSRLAIPSLGKAPKRVSADEAMAVIRSGARLYVHGHAASPTELLEALCRRVESANLSDIRPMHILMCGKVPWLDEKFHGKIRTNALFLCSGVRKLVKEDSHGYCTLGVNVDTTKAALENAKKIIALISPKIPRTYGNTLLHQSHIDYIVEGNRDLYGNPPDVQLPEDIIKIGELIAENLVDNGSTLQLGIGKIPDSTLAAMKNHKDIGIHTQLLGDGVMGLIDSGVINNSKKSVMPGKVVTSFGFGTQKFYQYCHENAMIHFECCSWTNHSDIIRANSKMVCINSGLEIDITGQVAAESIGAQFYSGFGGQTDFMTAAPTSYDGLGKSIIALTSRAKGISKIVTKLPEGTGVVTTRAHTRYVVTEYGIANLGGKNVRQRAHELIKIAHPDDRERLEREAFERLKCMPSADA